MNSTALSAIIVSVLYTMTHSHQHPDGVHLINRLSASFHFDHHIYFVDATDISNWLPPSSSSFNATFLNFIPQTVYTFASNVTTTKLVTLEEKISKTPFLIVVAEHFEDDSQLFAQVKVIHEIDVSVKFGVFFTRSIASLDIVEQLFRWSWRDGIFDIFCAFPLNGEDGEPSFNVFKYDPDGTFELINVTGSESFRDYFTDKLLKHRVNGVVQLSVLATPSEDAENPDAVVRVSHVSNQRSHAKKGKYNMQYILYPHEQSAVVMIVPHAQPDSDFMEYLQNGTWTLLFIFAFVVIATSTVLLAVSRYLQQKKILLFQCFSDVVNLLMNDNASIRYGNLHWADVFVIVPLTFTGLIVMNGIVSLFQSYLTSPIYRRQINSLYDLYVSSVPILGSVESGVTFNLVRALEYATNHGGWANRVQHSTQISSEAQRFNNSIAFAMDSTAAQIYLEVQRRLDLKAFHMLSDTYLARQFVSYTLNPNFPFSEILNDIVHRLTAAGLIDKWLRERNEEFVEKIWQLNRKRQFNSGLSLGEFTVPVVVWCGWIASGIAFISEIIWNRIESWNFSFSKRVLRSRVIHAVRVLQNWKFKWTK